MEEIIPHHISKALEDFSSDDFNNVPTGTRIDSKDKSFLVIKRRLCWEILCLSRTKADRHLEVTYNYLYLGQLFGPGFNMYNNAIQPKTKAGGHWHKDINELFINVSSDPLEVKLADPQKGNTETKILKKDTVTVDDNEYVKILMIPEGIAHLVENNGCSEVTLTVVTSGPHKDSDVFSYEL